MSQLDLVKQCNAYFEHNAYTNTCSIRVLKLEPITVYIPKLDKAVHSVSIDEMYWTSILGQSGAATLYMHKQVPNMPYEYNNIVCKMHDGSWIFGWWIAFLNGYH